MTMMATTTASPHAVELPTIPVENAGKGLNATARELNTQPFFKSYVSQVEIQGNASKLEKRKTGPVLNHLGRLKTGVMGMPQEGGRQQHQRRARQRNKREEKLCCFLFFRGRFRGCFFLGFRCHDVPS